MKKQKLNDEWIAQIKNIRSYKLIWEFLSLLSTIFA